MVSEFQEFLRALGPAGDEPNRYPYWFFQKTYNNFVVFGNFCSLVMVCWIIGQLWYNGTTILNALRQRAFKTRLGTILRAFCCGIATFITNPKYSRMSDTRDDVERLQEQEIVADDIGAIWIKLTQTDSVMEGPTSQYVKE